jgi:hypothetical protein
METNLDRILKVLEALGNLKQVLAIGNIKTTMYSRANQHMEGEAR